MGQRRRGHRSKMNHGSWRLLAVLLLVILGTADLCPAKKHKNSNAMDEQKGALHALDRLTFGPRPGDVQAVAATGVDKWIELELHPENIDDSAMQARLTNYRTLHMSSREMLLEFPPNPEGQLANVLRDFSQSIAAFWTDLGPLAEDTVVVTMSEFGRTARENGNRGTDHGHANVMFVLGEAVSRHLGNNNLKFVFPGFNNSQDAFLRYL